MLYEYNNSFDSVRTIVAVTKRSAKISNVQTTKTFLVPIIRIYFRNFSIINIERIDGRFLFLGVGFADTPDLGE